MFQDNARPGGAGGAPDPANANEQRADSGLFSLAVIAGHYRIAADPFQIAHDSGLGTHSATGEDIVRAATRIGLKARLLHGQQIGRLETAPLPAIIGDIGEMADKAGDMLRRSLTAFVERDERAARLICDEDDQVDTLYDSSYQALIQEMIRVPADVPRLTYLIWTCHNLERIADRVTNICERVIFMVTGQLEEINVSRY